MAEVMSGLVTVQCVS